MKYVIIFRYEKGYYNFKKKSLWKKTIIIINSISIVPLKLLVEYARLMNRVKNK